MSRHDDSTRLRHMLEAASKVGEFIAGLSLDAVRSDEMRALAVVRLLEIIGEAANVVSTEFRDANSEIPWPQIVGLRNRLIHGYTDVDWDVLWDIVTNDLPKLIDALQDLLGESPDE